MDEFINLLSVSLQHQYYPNSIQLRSITYKENYLRLSQERYDEIMNALPAKWSSPNEKITRFNVTTNGDGSLNYYIGMEKNVFDFKLKEYKTKFYAKTGSEEDHQFLYSFFTEKHSQYFLEDSENLYHSILETVDNVPLTSVKLKRMRDMLLSDSDKYMIPDYPISEEEREKWKIYRQELRDITKQENWGKNLVDIEVPVSPMPQKQFDMIKSIFNISQETYAKYGINYVDSKHDEYIKNIMSLSMKMEILSSLSKMDIPVFDDANSPEAVAAEIKNIRETLSFSDETAQDSDSDEQTSVFEKIEAKITEINEKIREYDLGFTVNDIIDEVLEKRKLTEEAEQIIGDL